MTGRFQNAVVVVTGGGARSPRALGIGEATCRLFAEEGATVVVVDHDEELAQRTVEQLESNGEVIAKTADVTDETAVEELATFCNNQFGTVDVLVNNAGIRIDPSPVTEVDGDTIDRIFDVNLKGMVRCCKHLIPLLSREEGGAVVNVSSANANVGRRGWTQYDASKAGVLGFTRDLACDHAAAGIRANAVSPGWTITDYHLPADETEAAALIEEQSARRPDGPGILKRNAMPREQAKAILFLASEDASYITGTNLHVDGGLNAVGHRIDS